MNIPFQLSPEYLFLMTLLLVALMLRKNKALVWMAVTYMAILALCRDISIGTDVGGYRDDFFRLHSLPNITRQIYHNFEWGYCAAILIFKEYSRDYMLFISLTWIPFFAGILKFIRDSHVRWAAALFVFLALGMYFNSFNIMRQYMAIAIILMFLPWLDRGGGGWKGYVPFAIAVVATAYCFHRSECMLLALIPIHWYVCRHPSTAKKTLYVALTLSFCVHFLNTRFLKDFFLYLNTFLPNAEYYAGYIEGVEDFASGYFQTFCRTLMALIIVYVKSPKERTFETYAYCLGVVATNIFSYFGGWGSRVGHDFNIFAITLIPALLYSRQTRHRKLFWLATMIYCLVYFYFCFCYHNYNAISPYRFR